MKKILFYIFLNCLITLFFSFVHFAKGQPAQGFQLIKLNRSISYSKLDTLTKQALLVWDNYLLNKSNDNFIKFNWSKEEQDFIGAQCSLRFKYIDYSASRNLYNYYKPVVLSITKYGSQFKIKTAFYRIENNSDVPYITDIVNNWVVVEDGRLVLQSDFLNNLKRMVCQKTDHLEIYSLNSIDKYILKGLDSINLAVSTFYNMSPLNVKYCATNSIDDYQRLRGYDYELTMFMSTSDGKPQQGALSEMANNLIFNGSLNTTENFAHELCHIYTYRSFGNNTEYLPYHNFLNEGLSTYLGGTTGKSLNYLLGQLYKETKSNTYKFDFTNLLDNSVGVGKEDANLVYIIGGLVCKLVYEKYGFLGINRLFKVSNSDELLYKAIEDILGVKRENLNRFIHDELKKHAQ
ncbi:hypothetical protein [Spirosoma montaniterrae]|uniref:Uncharacterized protein n=1 Tax=Spirosoma montaniterrae TaxID=1178516 RepID=A0A1P9WWN6_9BACT|nr:hypothetical protein [Spirosoma montaniterrae]AQG79781.1 hypothetical protein AWR27_10865 [Spirosoma montaniterrae]